MSKSAQISKLALFHLPGPLVAKLRFVLLRVVKVFDTIVSSMAGIPRRTLPVVFNMWTHFRRVRSKGTSTVFFVIETTLLLVVTVHVRARFCLEKS